MKTYKIKVSKDKLPLLIKRLGKIPYVTIGEGEILEVRAALSEVELKGVKDVALSCT